MNLIQSRIWIYGYPDSLDIRISCPFLISIVRRINASTGWQWMDCTRRPPSVIPMEFIEGATFLTGADDVVQIVITNANVIVKNPTFTSKILLLRYTLLQIDPFRTFRPVHTMRTSGRLHLLSGRPCKSQIPGADEIQFKRNNFTRFLRAKFTEPNRFCFKFGIP